MIIASILAFVALLAGFFLPLFFRRVVSTNEVHIVQSAGSTTSYGKDTGNGNSYYEWPSFLPVIGITKITLPTSVFDLDLTDYEAYDKGRLPFRVDVKAFFRITESNVAAQRVSSFDELHSQLKAIVQGAVRVVLASSEIEEIMQGRSSFGDAFTKEVGEQLSNWGVSTVKNIELMDLRDSANSKVIANIMEKKKSFIEMESRQAVANNKKVAEVSEIEAQREATLSREQATQVTGLRKVEAQREVELANQFAQQNIKDQQRVTKEKEMQILQVEHVNSANINKQVAEIAAEQAKVTSVITAQANLQTKKLQAEADLEVTKRAADGNFALQQAEAEGVKVNGVANAEAEKAMGMARAEAQKAMEMAPVAAQVTLAKEIGSNKEYQQYLITVEQIKATQAVGVEQAKALSSAEVKMIISGGDAQSGIKSVGDVFTAKGGMQLGALVEGFAQTDAGKAVLNTIGVNTDSKLQ